MAEIIETCERLNAQADMHAETREALAELAELIADMIAEAEVL